MLTLQTDVTDALHAIDAYAAIAGVGLIAACSRNVDLVRYLTAMRQNLTGSG